jgi:hypothetical protein
MTGSTGTSDQRTLTLQQYVADVLALETHIEEALDGQLRLAELQDHPAALAALQRAARDKDVRVRSAINKVLRGGGE